MGKSLINKNTLFVGCNDFQEHTVSKLNEMKIERQLQSQTSFQHVPSLITCMNFQFFRIIQGEKIIYIPQFEKKKKLHVVAMSAFTFVPP
jgi:hypothetical protein